MQICIKYARNQNKDIVFFVKLQYILQAKILLINCNQKLENMQSLSQKMFNRSYVLGFTGCPPVLFQSYLTGRSQMVIFGVTHYASWIDIILAVLQGMVLRPMFYSL